MTRATRNQAQGAQLRKHPWRAWNPGSLCRNDWQPAPESKHNPRTRRMERVK